MDATSELARAGWPASGVVCAPQAYKALAQRRVIVIFCARCVGAEHMGLHELQSHKLSWRVLSASSVVGAR